MRALGWGAEQRLQGQGAQLGPRAAGLLGPFTPVLYGPAEASPVLLLERPSVSLRAAPTGSPRIRWPSLTGIRILLVSPSRRGVSWSPGGGPGMFLAQQRRPFLAHGPLSPQTPAACALDLAPHEESTWGGLPSLSGLCSAVASGIL